MRTGERNTFDSVIGLAAALGLESGIPLPQAFAAPRTALEKVLAERWAEILKVERVGIHDDFFALGGDSLLVTHLVADVYDVMQLEIDVSEPTLHGGPLRSLRRGPPTMPYRPPSPRSSYGGSNACCAARHF